MTMLFSYFIKTKIVLWTILDIGQKTLSKDVKDDVETLLFVIEVR